MELKDQEIELLEGEIFMPIRGCEGRYEISNCGRVLSVNSKNRGRRILTGCNNKGYRMTELTDNNGNKKAWLHHRLVALNFIPKPDDKPHVNHIDGDRTNNHVSNLEWCTHQENIRHAWDIGLCKPRYKEDHGMYGKKMNEAFKEGLRNRASTNRKVYNTKTYRVYKSIREAAEVEGIDYTRLRHFLNRGGMYVYDITYCPSAEELINYIPNAETEQLISA